VRCWGGDGLARLAARSPAARHDRLCTRTTATSRPQPGPDPRTPHRSRLPPPSRPSPRARPPSRPLPHQQLPRAPGPRRPPPPLLHLHPPAAQGCPSPGRPPAPCWRRAAPTCASARVGLARPRAARCLAAPGRPACSARRWRCQRHSGGHLARPWARGGGGGGCSQRRAAAAPAAAAPSHQRPASLPLPGLLPRLLGCWRALATCRRPLPRPLDQALPAVEPGRQAGGPGGVARPRLAAPGLPRARIDAS
jgi:hypothetical protein